MFLLYKFVGLCYYFAMNNYSVDSVFQKNALTLAYLGDAVFTLMVREHLVSKTDFKANSLNKIANGIVCAKNQAIIMEQLKPELDEEETDLVLRARNVHPNNKAKNSSLQEYSLATQFEALVGFWYLKKENEKLKNMFKRFVEEKL